MKCPFCEKEFQDSADHCPYCQNSPASTETEKPLESKKIPSNSRLRTIIILGAVAAVAVGIFARPMGLKDTSDARATAKKHVTNGAMALMEGRYLDARMALERAVSVDQSFAEAHMSASLAYLALGEFKNAKHAAGQSLLLFEKHGVDASAWPGEDKVAVGKKGALIGARVRCVADAAIGAGVTVEESTRVFELMQLLASAADCNVTINVLDRWINEGRTTAVLLDARSNCADLWACKQLPSQAK